MKNNNKLLVKNIGIVIIGIVLYILVASCAIGLTIGLKYVAEHHFSVFSIIAFIYVVIIFTDLMKNKDYKRN